MFYQIIKLVKIFKDKRMKTWSKYENFDVLNKIEVCELTVRDKENWRKPLFVEYNIFYPRNDIGFSIRLMVKQKTGFGITLTPGETVQTWF